MTRRSLFAFSISMSIAAVALAGCGGSTTGGGLVGSGGSAGSSTGGSGTGGSGGSGGSSTGGAGGSTGGSGGNSTGGSGGGQACGGNFCKQGEQCCGNPSCGICAPQGGPCPVYDCIDAGPPVPCGPVTCPAGEMCCDATCGDCSGPGGACPGVSYCSDCAPQDVLGVGTCPTKLGYAWDGMNCNLINGCSCQGTDCYKLFPDVGSCYSAYSICMPAGA